MLPGGESLKKITMYITELSAIIGKEIEVTKWRDGKEKYQAKLSGIEAREGNLLSGVWEAGATKPLKITVKQSATNFSLRMPTVAAIDANTICAKLLLLPERLKGVII